MPKHYVHECDACGPITSRPAYRKGRGDAEALEYVHPEPTTVRPSGQWERDLAEAYEKHALRRD